MARFVVGVVAGIVITTLAGAALQLHADETSRDVREAAAAAGYDEQDLAGAVSSVGVDPWTYARWEGRLPPVQPKAPPPIASVWQRLAQCESSGRWNANTGNSYFGGLQEDMAFWRRHGGLAYAPRPDLASPAAQIAVAERGLAVQGFSAWPTCARRLGLTT